MSDDPVRLLDAPDPPAQLVELVRRLDPPPLPPAIRASVRARLPRHRVSPPWRVVGPTLAVAAVVGIGIVTWSIRETPPQPLHPPITIASDGDDTPLDPRGDDAHGSRADAEPQTSIGQRAPPPERTDRSDDVEVLGPAQSPFATPVPAGLDASIVHAAAMESIPRMQRCLERAVPEDDARPFTIDVTIDASGRVTRARFDDRPRSGASCALAIVRAWRFPQATHETRVRIPFVVRGAPRSHATDVDPVIAPTPSGTGRVIIQTTPFARVFLDQRDTHRTTPVRDLVVSAGSHVIGLLTEDGLMHPVSIVVRPGETVRIVRQLGAPHPSRSFSARSNPF